jgi:hypothetical protein
MTDDKNVCVMVQNVSTVLIRHHQEILYNTEKKYTKMFLAWWWATIKAENGCSAKYDCCDVTTNVKHKRFPNH